MSDDYDDFAVAMRMHANEQGIFDENRIQAMIDRAKGVVSTSTYNSALSTLMAIRSYVPQTAINVRRREEVERQYYREIIAPETGMPTMDMNNPLSFFTDLAQFMNRRMDPVPVVLKDDAYKKIQTIKFSEVPGKDSGDCPICYDEFEPDTDVKVLPCKHIFHPDCIKRWLTEFKHTCPVCKESSGDHEAKI